MQARDRNGEVRTWGAEQDINLSDMGIADPFFQHSGLMSLRDTIYRKDRHASGCSAVPQLLQYGENLPDVLLQTELKQNRLTQDASLRRLGKSVMHSPQLSAQDRNCSFRS